jgi:hypothetical protein
MRGSLVRAAAAAGGARAAQCSEEAASGWDDPELLGVLADQLGIEVRHGRRARVVHYASEHGPRSCHPRDLARWPQVMSTLLERAVRRTHRTVETRLVVLFWHLAERWGHGATAARGCSKAIRRTS